MPTLENELNALVQALGITGNEDEVLDLMHRYLQPYGKCTRTSSALACELPCKAKDPKRLVISAHADACGFYVGDLNPDGSLAVIPFGLQPKEAHLQPVLVHSGAERLEGVVMAEKKGDRTSYSVDLGYTCVGDLQKAHNVRKGDPVYFSNALHKLSSGCWAGPRLDNRWSCYFLLMVAEALKGRKLDVQLILAATTQEETGSLRGARMIGQTMHPDAVIVTDVTFAEGSVEMGEGACITFSDRSIFIPLKMRDTLNDLAMEKGIPLQWEVLNYSGSEAGVYSLANFGIPVVPLMFPIRNMHSPWEIADPADLKHGLKLVEAIIDRFAQVFA